jgi:hypothetical protein
VTSPTTRATRRCAARCCGRIDLVPSRRLALAWFLWLAACLATLAAGVAWPVVVRLAFGLVLVAANLGALRRGVLLRGSQAIHRIDWDDAGAYRLWSGKEGDGCEATLHPGSFRLGIACLVLWFSTPAGRRWVLIDGGIQDRVAFRRLARHLARGMLLPSGPKV